MEQRGRIGKRHARAARRAVPPTIPLMLAFA